MPVIGEGAYGCAHKPSLKCKGKLNINDDYISKILTKDDAKTELNEFKLLTKKDPNENHFLGKPISCYPDNIQNNIVEIKKCKSSNVFLKNIKNNKLLIMKYGGHNLKKHINTVINKNADKNIKITLSKQLLSDFIQVLDSSQFFIENNIAHRDIKSENIVYNDRNMKMIDFGLLKDFKTIIKESKNNNYFLGQIWWSISPICILFNKNLYSKINSENQRLYAIQLIQKIINTTEFAPTLNNIDSITIDNKNGRKIFFNSILSLFEKIPENKYKSFMKLSVQYIDMFNFGFTIFEITQSLKQNLSLSNDFYDEINNLCMKMMSCDVFNHISINYVINKYKSILVKYNIFENKTSPSPVKIDDIIIKGYNSENSKITKDTLLHYLKHCDTGYNFNYVTKKCEKICKEHQEINPITRRCNKKCKSGYKRNITFKCTKHQTI